MTPALRASARMTNPTRAAKTGNFLRQIIERDLAEGTYAGRRFAGSPGDAAHHAAGPLDPARIRTRFPPEPNGYLHIGHAKSITLNFGLAREYGGVCHLRFDDTNPEKEEQEYVDAIVDAVHWLGFDWQPDPRTATRSHLYYASDYFDFMYRAAEALIEAGHAYVDEQSADEMRANRGDFATKPAPTARTATARRPRTWRAFARCAPASWPTAPRCCARRSTWRARTSTCATRRSTASSARPTTTPATPGASTRCTPTRTRSRTRSRTSRTASARSSSKTSGRSTTGCSTRCATLGLLAQPRPHQYEFARLNLTYVITSKRKLRQLVDEGHRRRLGRPAHADARRPAPPRLHARKRSA